MPTWKSFANEFAADDQGVPVKLASINAYILFTLLKY